jgi:hypothetical protein
MAHRREVGASEGRAASASRVPTWPREPNPGADIVDSQRTKTPRVGGQQRGLEPAKKNVEGTKRRVLLDTEGSVMKAKVESARVPDQDGIRPSQVP